jgi:predicted phosphatase
MDLSLARFLRLHSYHLQPSTVAYAHTHETIVSNIWAVMEEIALIQMRSWISFYSIILTKMN